MKLTRLITLAAVTLAAMLSPSSTMAKDKPEKGSKASEARLQKAKAALVKDVTSDLEAALIALELDEETAELAKTKLIEFFTTQRISRHKLRSTDPPGSPEKWKQSPPRTRGSIQRATVGRLG